MDDVWSVARPDAATQVATWAVIRYSSHTMISGFRHRGLERLFEKGDRAGYWAVKVSANWRVVFRFEGGDVRDVDLTDYH